MTHTVERTQIIATTEHKTRILKREEEIMSTFYVKLISQHNSKQEIYSRTFIASNGQNRTYCQNQQTGI